MYFSYKNYTIDYNEQTHSFSCFYRPDGQAEKKPFISDAVIGIRSQYGKSIVMSDYAKIEYKTQFALDHYVLIVTYSDGPVEAPWFELLFKLNSRLLHIETVGLAIVHIKGKIHWGDNPENSTFGIRMDAEDHHLRAACGPAYSIHDCALFDRLSDGVLEFKASEKFKVCYDWSDACYRFDFESSIFWGRSLKFRIHEKFCRHKFNIPYAPISKQHGFKTPPVGWMTWYSAQFKTNEKSVLENTKQLAAVLGKYTDKLCIWIDWEWNHKCLDGLGQDGVDTFHPRPETYPHGLAHVAAEITRLGLIPALWIGATNDGRKNHLMLQHPEWVLTQQPEWCGQWWIDPSHPGVVDEYIPTIFKQIMQWGYKVIKWDCILKTLQVCDEFHDKFHIPELSSDTSMRQLVESARRTVGPDIYMLSCAGYGERDITLAMDIFDAARIGDDVFGWSNFISNSVERVFYFYPWHNVVFYADGDNLVLRNELNTLEQARFRVSFYGLTGLPVTIGDPFEELDESRLDMLKRIIPVADIHPMDMHHKLRGDNAVIVNLAVCKPFGEWNVIGIMNPEDKIIERHFSLESDFHIDTRNGQTYAVYDFWKGEFLGVFCETFSIAVAPMDAAVLRITPLNQHPQLISTSRHITQGGYDLDDLQWNETEKILSGKSKVIADEIYRMTLYLPMNYELANVECIEQATFTTDSQLLIVDLHSECSGELIWKLCFVFTAENSKSVLSN